MLRLAGGHRTVNYSLRSGTYECINRYSFKFRVVMGKVKAQHVQKFCDEWLHQSKFAEWLASIDGDDGRLVYMYMYIYIYIYIYMYIYIPVAQIHLESFHFLQGLGWSVYS